MRAQLTIGSITSGLRVLGTLKKAGWASPGEQASKQGSSYLLCQVPSLGSCPGFTEWLIFMWKCKQNTSSASFDNCVYHSNREIKESANALNHLAISLTQKEILHWNSLISHTCHKRRIKSVLFNKVRKLHSAKMFIMLTWALGAGVGDHLTSQRSQHAGIPQKSSEQNLCCLSLENNNAREDGKRGFISWKSQDKT